MSEEYNRSQLLTEFIQKKGLSFSKWNGRKYEEFSVSCAPLALPLPLSLFEKLQSAAQALVGAMRCVLQEIYGEKIPEKSQFIRSLTVGDRKIFLDAIYSSPHYFPALHHPVMKEYPFFDVVGLDLVLTQDMEHGGEEGSDIPFRLLEINAGAPSGAANNMHIIDGLLGIDPELIANLGSLLPNDHFSILRETYDSLGRSWTCSEDGISIIIPPGGENGATPEIHELAARSGLVYCNSGQIYRDNELNIRMRSADGVDPRVTSIYSRVNADSLLFDPGQNIVLRDPETGDPLTLEDSLRSNNEETSLLPPLESLYQIPGIIDAIHGRRIYLGSLNRLLDNKIILNILCANAPKFFERQLQLRGIDVRGTIPLLPPRSLPSTSRTLRHVLENPKQWVVKSPNLSGGKGIHILRCLTPRARAKVLKLLRRDPTSFALQELVPIGRIPVPVRQYRGFRYANIAADMRMWVFYGDGKEAPRPRLTRNALVRTAPKEKGPLSSIVNTSMGGGYAGMVVVDDVSPWSEGNEGVVVLDGSPAPAVLPLGAGAELRQTARIVRELLRCVREGRAASYLLFLATELRHQVREVMSFLDGECVEVLHELLDCAKDGIDITTFARLEKQLAHTRIALVGELSRLKTSSEFVPFFSTLEGIFAWDFRSPYSIEKWKHDESLLCAGVAGGKPRLLRLMARLVELRLSDAMQRNPQPERLEELARRFLGSCQRSLEARSATKALLPFFDLSLRDEPKALGHVLPQTAHEAQRVGTWWEWWHRRSLLDAKVVESELLLAREAWLRVLEQARELPAGRRARFLHAMHERHLKRFPVLAYFQDLIDGQSDLSWSETMLALLRILPYARFNLSALAARQGISLDDLFVGEPQVGRVAVLSRAQRQARGWSVSPVGECALHKPSPRALYSESALYMWIGAEAHPLVAAYTAGHEAIHALQFESLLEAEVQAQSGGTLAWVDFAHRTAAIWEEPFSEEQILRVDALQGRRTLHGFSYAQAFGRGCRWLGEMREAAERGASFWNGLIERLGVSAAYATEPTLAARVRALREVIPALENAKNIKFVKELGLRWNASPVRAALPCANGLQREAFAPALERLAVTLKPDHDDLRLVASCQLFGVFFPQSSGTASALDVEAGFGALGYGGVGCQSQQ